MNVMRSQAVFTHFSRSFTQFRSTGSPARRVSFGRVRTISWTRDDSVPQSGHADAPSQSVTAHISTAPDGPGSASDPQAGNAEQRGRRIVEHDARCFLVLMSLVRPESPGAAGFLVPATLRTA